MKTGTKFEDQSKATMKCDKCGILVDGGRRRLIQHKQGYHSY